MPPFKLHAKFGLTLAHLIFRVDKNVTNRDVADKLDKSIIDGG